MDPISTSIIAAVAQLGATAVKDAYDALKSLLVRKFGGESRVVEAVTAVEDQPASEGRKIVLGEEVAAAGAAEDDEIVRAAATLKTALEAHAVESTVSVRQTVHGDHNVFSGTGDVRVEHRGD